MTFQMNINGILNVNKPEGKTSFSIVAWLKRLSGEKRVGHAGTLDPIATGVLPICFGQATRVVQFLANCPKTYLAQVELGAVTNTLDREGTITRCKDPSNVTTAQIEQALLTFKGPLEQVPPRYSALKHKGKPYYALAREGVHLEPKPRPVTIFSIDLVEVNIPCFTIKVTCSKGTYIRSLAHDLGQYLGYGAYLKNLTRTQYGTLCIDDALPVSEIKCIFHKGIWNEYLYPVDTPLLDWQAIIVGEAEELAIRNGRLIFLDSNYQVSEQYCRAYSKDGSFIALLHFLPEQNLWHPDKVFSLEQAEDNATGSNCKQSTCIDL